MQHAHTKHVETDCHFIRGRVLKKHHDIQYCNSEDQLANLLIKPLGTERFQSLKIKLLALPRS